MWDLRHSSLWMTFQVMKQICGTFGSIGFAIYFADNVFCSVSCWWKPNPCQSAVFPSCPSSSSLNVFYPRKLGFALFCRPLLTQTPMPSLLFWMGGWVCHLLWEEHRPLKTFTWQFILDACHIVITHISHSTSHHTSTVYDRMYLLPLWAPNGWTIGTSTQVMFLTCLIKGSTGRHLPEYPKSSQIIKGNLIIVTVHSQKCALTLPYSLLPTSTL